MIEFSSNEYEMACMSKPCLAIDYLYPLSFHEQTETRHTCILFSHGNKIICGFDCMFGFKGNNICLVIFFLNVNCK